MTRLCRLDPPKEGSFNAQGMGPLILPDCSENNPNIDNDFGLTSLISLEPNIDISSNFHLEGMPISKSEAILSSSTPEGDITDNPEGGAQLPESMVYGQASFEQNSVRLRWVQESVPEPVLFQVFHPIPNPLQGSQGSLGLQGPHFSSM